MSLILIVLVVSFLLIVFSQFGGRLKASDAAPWWLTAAFLVVAVVYPAGLVPVARFLGVELVSNLVLASLIFFLFLKLFVVSVGSSKLQRKLRDMITTRSAR